MRDLTKDEHMQMLCKEFNDDSNWTFLHGLMSDETGKELDADAHDEPTFIGKGTLALANWYKWRCTAVGIDYDDFKRESSIYANHVAHEEKRRKPKPRGRITPR